MAKKVATSLTIVVTTLFLFAPISPVVASETSTPTPNPTAVKTHHIIFSSPPLTAEQKAGQAAAKQTFLSALSAAKSTFDLFAADARANRDEAIIAANGDKKLKAIAQTQFRSAMVIAIQTKQSAIARANAEYEAALKKLGISSGLPH